MPYFPVQLRDKQLSLAAEMEKHQLVLAEKESLEAVLKGNAGGGDSSTRLRQMQQQLDALRKELQTSMNSETRVREELSASQSMVNALRQQVSAIDP